MKTHFQIRTIVLITLICALTTGCNLLVPLPTEQPVVDDAHTEQPESMPQSGFPDKPALPSDSGIEGVQTFPDKSEYHNHVVSLPEPEGEIPPPFGAHFSAWQNCGIYDEPIELGHALHSLEHGAVWLTYSPELHREQIVELKSLVRGHDFVLMSPYPPQTTPVVLTGWGVQLVIDSLPDERIAQFIAYYENGPQNPEPGAPCSGAIGNPLP